MADVTTMDLAGFLKARLDEDEVIARGRLSARRQVKPKAVFRDGRHVPVSSLPSRSGPVEDDYRRHFTPGRAMREVETKRRILERAVAEIEDQDPPRASAIFASGVLLLLALPYADHPEYHEEWRL